MFRSPQTHARTPHWLSTPNVTRVAELEARAAGSAAMRLGGLIDKTTFRSRFPNFFHVRAIDLFEAAEKNLTTDRTYWHYDTEFVYVSDRFGKIVIPEGFVTDFASVPPRLRSVYDDDSPILLYPSGPHDLLFKPLAEGTPFGHPGERGWFLDGSKRLSLSQTNLVLAEAMWYCGASHTARSIVYAAVELANWSIRHEFAPEFQNKKGAR